MSLKGLKNHVRFVILLVFVGLVITVVLQKIYSARGMNGVIAYSGTVIVLLVILMFRLQILRFFLQFISFFRDNVELTKYKKARNELEQVFKSINFSFEVNHDLSAGYKKVEHLELPQFFEDEAPVVWTIINGILRYRALKLKDAITKQNKARDRIKSMLSSGEFYEPQEILEAYQQQRRADIEVANAKDDFWSFLDIVQAASIPVVRSYELYTVMCVNVVNY